ncbi:MAG: ABC transporter substrate-binding protein [Actinomycetota bacterium]|nr:ABC transporter substrate-binding protein [Actinomycetota bacterium]
MAEAGEPLLTIGEVAERAEVPPSTLRFYEAEGLIPAPPRVSGRRRYDPAVLRRLAVIDTAKRAGFTLPEIRELLAGFDGLVPSSDRWGELAAPKLPEIRAVIEGAHRMERLLEEGFASVRLAGGPWGYPSPFGYRRGPGLTLATYLFDTLLWKDPSGRFVPWLAERWERSGTEYRFTLRPHLQWHDGRPLTAGDVVFTFEYLTEGPGAATGVIQLHGLDRIREVVADGPQVTFRLVHPYAPFLEWVAGRMLVLPAHVWGHVDDPEGFRGEGTVMGSGPYTLAACDEAAGRYLFTANGSYFLGSPYIRRLEFTPVADQLEALRRREIDAALFITDRAFPSTNQLGEFHHPRYRSSIAPGEWMLALHFDLRRGFPFTDRRFRHAVAHAIDRRQLVRQLLGDLGEAGSPGGMAPAHPLTPPDLPTYEHDPGRARGLLDEVGLADRSSGIRELPDGSPLRLRLHVGPWHRRAADLVRDHLRAVGLSVAVVPLAPSAAEAAAVVGDYDMALLGYGALAGDPDWLRIRLSQGSQERTPAKVHGYLNPRFEDLAARQAAEADPSVRDRLIRDMLRLVAEDLPMVPLYVPHQLEISATKHVFDAWRSTPGGVWGGFPGPFNKCVFISGEGG